MDGYCRFVAMAEWWRLKTPFSQWFTKNYTGVFLPLAHLLGMEVGHVALSANEQVHEVLRMLCLW